MPRGGGRPGAGPPLGPAWEHGLLIFRLHEAVSLELAERSWRLKANAADWPHAGIRASRDIMTAPLLVRILDRVRFRRQHRIQGSGKVAPEVARSAAEQAWGVMDGRRKLYEQGRLFRLPGCPGVLLMARAGMSHGLNFLLGQQDWVRAVRRWGRRDIDGTGTSKPMPEWDDLEQWRALHREVTSIGGERQDEIGRYTRIGIPDVRWNMATAEETARRLNTMGIIVDARTVLRIHAYWRRRWEGDDARNPDETGTV